MADITIVYTVGGEERHYKNLEKSIRSLERLTFKPNIHIYDMNKLGIKVSNEIAWKSKYTACLEAKGDIIWYIDTDMVVVQDNINKCLDLLGGQLGLPRHWYINDTLDYCQKSCPDPKYTYNVVRPYLKYGNSAFPAAGTFIYENTVANRNMLNDVLDLYNTFMKYDPIENKITDELILNCVAKCTLHSAFNHSFMPDQKLGLLDDNTWVGSSDFENDWDVVSLGHCDTFRRNPSLRVEKPENQSRIRKLFYI